MRMTMALQIQTPDPSFTRDSRLLHPPTRPKLVVRFQKPSGRSVGGQKNRWIIWRSPVEKPGKERESFSSYLGWARPRPCSSNVWMGINKDLIPAICFAFSLVVYIVGTRYLRYLEAKLEIEDSEELMRNTLKNLEAIPKHTWDQFPTHMFVLERWGKRREEATAYMAKHKLMGKVVEFFHPKKIDNN